MKQILIVGVGGVGSFLLGEVCECLKNGLIDAVTTRITIADHDIVEVEQVSGTQNFSLEDVGEYKAEALAEKYKEYGVKARTERIEKAEQLKGYDLVFCCVDNMPTRELITRESFKQKFEFIDLRASGRSVTAIPKIVLEDNERFLEKDEKAYSCQEAGMVNLGNKIASVIGSQMLLNLSRGQTNKLVVVGV